MTPKNDKELSPIYAFDNNNHSLFGWLEAFHMGLLEAGSLLIRIDAHDDLDSPPPEIEARIVKGRIPALKEGHDITRSLWIREFVWPAYDWGLFKKIHTVLSPGADMVMGPPGNQRFEITDYVKRMLSSLKHEKKSRIAVDIDVDVTDYNLELILAIAEIAGVTTLASSPSCIDQRTGIERERELVDTLAA
ncbi:MAG: hypothetical protein KKA31_03600 [Candidatus Margulisbacteria bacterium]|nr:hypothetical protein [Candidatus Margulisiibacteriota bacterium]